MTALIITGGYESDSFIEEQLKSIQYDILIGVDSGLNYLYRLNILPDILLGDFDSISEEALAFYKGKNIITKAYPSEKNLTDTHLAIETALEYAADHIILLAATGSRLDHTLANIFLLQNYLDQADCQIITFHNLTLILSFLMQTSMKILQY